MSWGIRMYHFVLLLAKSSLRAIHHKGINQMFSKISPKNLQRPLAYLNKIYLLIKRVYKAQNTQKMIFSFRNRESNPGLPGSAVNLVVRWKRVMLTTTLYRMMFVVEDKGFILVYEHDKILRQKWSSKPNTPHYQSPVPPIIARREVRWNAEHNCMAAQ
jgi:hypothetical protein